MQSGFFSEEETHVCFAHAKPVLLLLLAIAGLAAGLTLILLGGRLIDVFHYIVGAFSFASAVVSFISAYLLRDKPNYRVAIGVMLIALSFLTVLSPHSPVFVCVLWGILSIVKAAFGIDKCVKLRMKGGRCAYKFLFDFIELTLGIVLLLELTDALGHHILFLGAALTVYGLEYLLRFWYALRRKKEEKERESEPAAKEAAP